MLRSARRPRTCGPAPLPTPSSGPWPPGRPRCPRAPRRRQTVRPSGTARGQGGRRAAAVQLTSRGGAIDIRVPVDIEAIIARLRPLDDERSILQPFIGTGTPLTPDWQRSGLTASPRTACLKRVSGRAAARHQGRAALRPIRLAAPVAQGYTPRSCAPPSRRPYRVSGTGTRLGSYPRG